ncbi:uncharacterized protein MAM_00248 [Metarhizium album ARSEF 1941]|uniref:Uncharacterized protein n=1 Tax=Metarhizium album (strain ARSEF 1941) TaxID=1081103 RepID=A0A0B2WYD0_METAS|nr:uncharacterized protein MAM_00248 [Metarhizium album ARSEF 1941]KHO01247.1 hypothetical protein MAM_00248 [Metarhizium album ARSEF 1941]
MTTLALLPVVIPAGYVLYTGWTVYRTTTSVSGTLVPRQATSASKTSHPAEPHSLAAEVGENRCQWVVTYERVVSEPLPLPCLDYPPKESPLSSKPAAQPSRLLQEVSRSMQKAFRWTPQAAIIRGALSEPLNRRSFDTAWIDNLCFKPGDVVNGVYKVSCSTTDQATGSERVELLIDTPPSYRGPRVRGLILAAIEPASPSMNSDDKGPAGGRIVIVNETWMWRLADEKPTLLESSVGRWLHRLLAGWLVLKGVSGACRKREDVVHLPPVMFRLAG